MALLEVRDLAVQFATDDGVVRAVDGVSFSVDAGRSLGIVGESGSGKSVSNLSVLGLTRARNARFSGEVLFEGRDLLKMSEEELREVRGEEIAMIFQDPLSSLHPFYRVGDQLVEAVRAHHDVSKKAGADRAIEMLQLVGIPEPRARIDAYPHEFSGGMRQRAMIAMALINSPKLLIADEPTTALDVTVQAQILELIERLQAETGTAVIMITHDLGVVAEMTHEIAVMYAGRIVERAPTAELFAAPQHPYTWGLLRSIPRLDSPRDEELVPIEGRPPSLITRPTGCAFHPRCPFVREAHKRIDPRARAASRAGATTRSPACSPQQTRSELWQHLAAGEAPERARARRPDGRLRRMSVDATPAGRRSRAARSGDALIEVRDLVKEFPIKGSYLVRRQLGAVHAVDGVSFDVRRGETFGIVGESGCGKSTTARLLMRLLEPTSGSVRFDGREIAGAEARSRSSRCGARCR